MMEYFLTLEKKVPPGLLAFNQAGLDGDLERSPATNFPCLSDVCWM